MNKNYKIDLKENLVQQQKKILELITLLKQKNQNTIN